MCQAQHSSRGRVRSWDLMTWTLGTRRAGQYSRVSATWNAMRQTSGGLPLGHDGFLKFWALSKPQARTDDVMVDEAQDLNPVLLSVLEETELPRDLRG